MDVIKAVGRRKSAVARVLLKKGNGKITVNAKDHKSYFTVNHLISYVEQPVSVIDASDKFDISVNVTGGGIKGQAQAVQLGISRALCEVNPEFRPALKANKLLTRDPRVVERKKPGLRKARKATQYSKR